jgi:hypothetical protein
MTATVFIANNAYCYHPIKNATLPLLKGFRPTPGDFSGSGTITVDGSSLGFPNKIRLRGKKEDFVFSGIPDIQSSFVKNPVQDIVINDVPLEGDYNGETEEDAINRINERFDILNEMAQAVAFGSVRSVIVSGPPGIGKSFGVEDTMQVCCGADYLATGIKPYETIRGTVSPIGLYMKLFEYSEAGKVIVFDDSDSVLLDPDCLGLLKTALDTSKKRVLSWNKESYALKDTDVPSRFEFKGGIVFLTNLSFTNVRSKQLAPHLEALMSRSHYLDLGIANQRDKFLRIKGVVVGSDMLEDYNFSKEQREAIMDYIKVNINSLRDLSLRTVIKLADLVQMKDGIGWERIANLTLLRNSGV